MRVETVTPAPGRSSTMPLWLLGVAPLVLLALLLLLIVKAGPVSLLQPEGAPPIERLVIERATLDHDGIHLSVLNDGPDAVTIAQVAVDDAYWAFTVDGERKELSHLGRARVHVPYPWVAGEAHLLKVISSTGTVFEHEIAVAVPTPRAEGRHLAAFTLMGLYVGVIPVALGLLWLPLVSRLGRVGLDVLLAVTLGLLAFLLVDTTHEGIGAAELLPGSYQGPALFAAAAFGSYLVLESFSGWIRRRRMAAAGTSSGALLALLVATGIGLHNFGEGLAIGAAFALGEAALGTLLVIGFTLHNTTEGLAIIAPLAKERPSWRLLATLGVIGGAPTIAGAWAGGLIYSPLLAVIFLGFGAGAIAQVVLQIARQMAGGEPLSVRFSSAPVLGGLAAGFMIMVVTGMLVG